MTFALALLVTLAADEYSAEPLKEGAPQELSESVRKELTPAGTRILKDGKAFADFWLRAALPTDAPKEQNDLKFALIKPGTLVGAVRYPDGGSDFRGQKISAGVYTLRYGVQPEDGDHQGTADTKDFLIVAPAALDVSPALLSQDQAHKLSTKASGTKHPAVLYLVKAKDGEKLPRLTRDEAHERWVFECESKPARLGIVVVGKAAE